MPEGLEALRSEKGHAPVPRIFMRKPVLALSLLLLPAWLLAPQGVQVLERLAVGRGDPRKPISSLPFVITECGSYVLTRCLTGVAGQDGITIAASDVTLDLDGFSLNGVPASLSAVQVSGGQEGILVTNGVVRGWGQSGISLVTADLSSVTDLRVLGCGADGIVVRQSCSVSDCISSSNGGTGLRGTAQGNTFSRCVASGNSGAGLDVSERSLVLDCTARGNGGDGIRLQAYGILRSCTSGANQGSGIDAGDTSLVEDCVAADNFSHGIRLNDRVIAHDCVSMNNGASGIRLQAYAYVSRCILTNNAGHGAELISRQARFEDNQVTENVAGGIWSPNGCGNFFARNTAANAPTCGPNATVLYDLGTGNNAGQIVDKPGASFSADPWANFGL
jgi:parallel beta helix pectate lyase-like protein